MIEHAPRKASKRVKDLPITRLLPNMLTVLSLCAGLTAIRFALIDQWSECSLAIVIAGVFDVLDGRVARMLNITSKFGAELDSLSDMISFGAAPAFIMYVWTLRDMGGFGWAASLVYAVCIAMRLARFNTMLEDQTQPSWTKRYFTGVPAPAGAGLVLLPLNLFLEFGDAVHVPNIILALWMIVVGALTVSRVPTFALKGWRISPQLVAPVFLIAVISIAALITNTWLVLSLMAIVYLACLPVGWYSYRRQSRKTAIAGSGDYDADH